MQYVFKFPFFDVCTSFWCGYTIASALYVLSINIFAKVLSPSLCVKKKNPFNLQASIRETTPVIANQGYQPCFYYFTQTNFEQLSNKFKETIVENELREFSCHHKKTNHLQRYRREWMQMHCSQLLLRKSCCGHRRYR
jgi:hypothetical protein